MPTALRLVLGLGSSVGGAAGSAHPIGTGKSLASEDKAESETAARSERRIHGCWFAESSRRHCTVLLGQSLLLLGAIETDRVKI